MAQSLSSFQRACVLVVSGFLLCLVLFVFDYAKKVSAASYMTGPKEATEQFLTLGAGPTADARFGLGGLIATSLSAPLSGPSCERGGPCGVPGLVVAARSYDGSPAAIRGLLSGTVDLALVRTDVAMQALQRQGSFNDLVDADNLVALARLYAEAILVVVPKDSPIQTLADLRGKQVAVLAPYGGPNWQLTKELMAAHGLKDGDVTLIPVSHDGLVSMANYDRVDAAVVVDLPPAPVLESLESFRFLPLEDSAREGLRHDFPWLAPTVLLPDQNHRAVLPTLTLGIPVLLMARKDMPPQLAQEIVASLQRSDRYGVFARADSRGDQMHADVAAVRYLGLPLHPALQPNKAESVQTPLAPIDKER